MDNYIIYAHTKKNVSESDWELLWGQNGHAEKVRKRILYMICVCPSQITLWHRR